MAGGSGELQAQLMSASHAALAQEYKSRQVTGCFYAGRKACFRSVCIVGYRLA